MPAFLLALLPTLTAVLDRVIPDPLAKAKAIQEIMDMAAKSEMGQLEVNKAEAASSSVFVAGWRPFIGWVCGAAMAYQYVLLPVGTFIASFFDPKISTILLNAPRLDNNLWELLTAMLGMGALRSFDKLKGLTK